MGKGMRAGKKPSAGGAGGGANMQKQMQQMQVMQKKMEEMQAELETKEVGIHCWWRRCQYYRQRKERNRQSGDKTGSR